VREKEYRNGRSYNFVGWIVTKSSARNKNKTVKYVSQKEELIDENKDIPADNGINEGTDKRFGR
jgi:hypothetical protein